MKYFLQFKGVLLLLLLTSVVVNAQLQPVQNIPLNGSSVYGTSTYIGWYFNGYEAGITVELQVSTHSDLSSPFVDATGLTALTYNVTGLSSGIQYYWRIRSKSSGGAYSSWSSIWSFTAASYGGGGTASVPVPQLNIPLDSTTVTSTSTSLAWYLNASSYGLTFHLQVSTSSNFSSFFINDSGLTNLSYSLSGLSDSTTYYWRVRSKNGSGTKSSWSSVFSFKIKLTATTSGTSFVQIPSHISPGNGATTDFTAVTLKWSYVFNASGYFVEVYTDTTSTPVDSAWASSTSYTFYLDPATTYYWRVKASTSGGDSDYSWFWSFTTGNNMYWYVDDSGDDSNFGYLPDSPLKTIQAAIDSSSDGDKIIVGGGTYNESLVISNQIEIVSSLGADSTIIYGQTSSAITIGSDNIVINGFTITNPSGKYGLYSSDYSKLVIKNNIFTDIASGDLTTTISNYALGIISSSSAVDSIFIYNNTFSYIYGGAGKKSVIGIVIGWTTGSEDITNLVIKGNTITNIIPSDTEWGAYGILINHSTTGAEIVDNTISYLSGLWVHGLGLEGDTPDALITDNTFSNITATKSYDKYALFFESNPSLGTVSFNNNYVNTDFGLGIHSDLLAGLTTEIVDAENNWWGDGSGPSGFGLSGSGAAFGTDDSLESITSYVDYIPWLGGSPVLMIEDDSTTTGGTVSLDININLFSDSLSYTFIGQFAYDDSKLDYLSGMVGSGTILNSSGWSVVFYETTPGVVGFIAYGFTPVSGSGKLFTLSFKVIAGTGGAASVSGSYGDFIADGSYLFGTSGSFDGEVFYTASGTPSTLQGDADLDGSVDYDDITVMAQHITGALTLTGQAFTNADVDADSTIDADDIAATVNYIIYGSWSVSPSVVSSSSLSFKTASEDNAGQVYLPFSIDGASSGSKITSVEFTIYYDEDELDYQSFKGAFENEATFVNASKVEDGVAKFIFASASGIDKAQEIGGFLLKKNAAELTSSITSAYRVNDGDLIEGPSYSLNGVTDVGDEELPSEFELSQNYPNPFNPSTTINYALPSASYVTIKVYNILGQEIKTLVSQEMMAGKHNIVWNGVNDYGQKVASGVYLYRISAGNFIQSKKMLLLK